MTAAATPRASTRRVNRPRPRPCPPAQYAADQVASVRFKSQFDLE